MREPFFIAHRGNLNGPVPSRENRPDYIEKALERGHLAEIDLRAVGRELFLGHDFPQYRISREWIERRKDFLLIHLKDHASVALVRDSGWHTFCHSNDPYTVTSRGYTWLHDMSLPSTDATIVPLLTMDLIRAYPAIRTVYGICSDFNPHV